MSARRIPADFPGKQSLTEVEAAHSLQRGPDLKWFEPWATRVIDMTGVNRGQYGYVHVYMRNGGFRVDSASWPTEEGLARGLEDLWRDHGGEGLRSDPSYPRCDDCLGVSYFVADEEPRLRAVIEPDGEGEENPAWHSVTRPVGKPRAGDERADS